MQSIGIYFDGDSTMVGLSNVGGTIIGDINADGHDVQPGTGQWFQQPDNEPATIQRFMDQQFGAGRVWTENHGIGGVTMRDSINGTNSLGATTGYASANGPQFTSGYLGGRIKATRCRIIVGKFLTNDRYRETPAAFGSMCTTWINTVKGIKNADGYYAIPVLAESNPICRLDAPDATPYLDAMHSACASAGILCIPQHDWIKANVPDWRAHLPDSVHPDTALLKIMGERSAACLQSVVATLLA